MNARRWRRRAGSRGQGLVEFALIVPMILLLLFAVIDLGRAVYVYNTVSQAARSAGRTAMVNQERAKIRTSAINAAPTLGLTTSNVTICFKDAGTDERDCDEGFVDTCRRSERVVGCLAIVVVRTTYRPITPVIAQLFSGFSMSATSVVAVEYVCPARTATTSTCI